MKLSHIRRKESYSSFKSELKIERPFTYLKKKNKQRASKIKDYTLETNKNKYANKLFTL